MPALADCWTEVQVTFCRRRWLASLTGGQACRHILHTSEQMGRCETCTHCKPAHPVRQRQCQHLQPYLDRERHVDYQQQQQQLRHRCRLNQTTRGSEQTEAMLSTPSARAAINRHTVGRNWAQHPSKQLAAHRQGSTIRAGYDHRQQKPSCTLPDSCTQTAGTQRPQSSERNHLL